MPKSDSRPLILVVLPRFVRLLHSEKLMPFSDTSHFGFQRVVALRLA